MLAKRVAFALGLRNVTRALGVTPEAVGNRIASIDRKTILLHEGHLKEAQFEVDLVAYGFESFCASQFIPDNYHIFEKIHSSSTSVAKSTFGVRDAISAW